MSKRLFPISIGNDLGGVKNKDVTWPELVKLLTTHKISKKKIGDYFVAGQFKDGKRKEHNMISRSLLTLDIDSYDGDIEALLFDLEVHFPVAFIAYSTFSHSDETPRIRVVIPLSKPVEVAQYRPMGMRFIESLQLDGIMEMDNCSYTPNQAMFLPTTPDAMDAWSHVQKGKPLKVDEFLVDGSFVAAMTEDDWDFTKDTPLDLTDAQVDAYLKYYPNVGLEYDQYLMIGAALHHQFGGSEEGLNRFIDWSAVSDKFDEKDCKHRYKSFGDTKKPVTFATVIHHINLSGGMPTGKFDELREEAKQLTSIDEYQEFKEKLLAISPALLQGDMRAAIAAEIFTSIGKPNGIGKADIKKAITPKTGKAVGERMVNLPGWCEHWVYIEKTCEFSNFTLGYSIKREAFNAKYDREPVVIVEEVPASVYALNIARIPTVVDSIWWPNGERLLNQDGMLMLNSYAESGVGVCSPEEFDSIQGKRVVATFLKHIETTLEDPNEQKLLLEWLAFIVQNPGKKINWALLLQGAEGTGKSYFGQLMQYLLGTGVRSLAADALVGRFSGWGTGAVLNVVEEIRIAGKDKYAALDRLKPFISNPTVQIEEKGRDHRTVPNFTSYLFLTNHKDAIPLSDGDRRYLVFYSRLQSKDELLDYLGGEQGVSDYFDTLFNATEQGAEILKRFLLQYEISKAFQPNGRAPHTKAKDEMRKLGESPDRVFLMDAIEDHHCKVVNGDIIDMTHLTAMCEMEGAYLPSYRSLNKLLTEMGYAQVSGGRIKISATGKMHRIWVKPLSRYADEGGLKNIRALYSSVEEF